MFMVYELFSNTIPKSCTLVPKSWIYSLWFHFLGKFDVLCVHCWRWLIWMNLIVVIDLNVNDWLNEVFNWILMCSFGWRNEWIGSVIWIIGCWAELIKQFILHYALVLEVFCLLIKHLWQFLLCFQLFYLVCKLVFSLTLTVFVSCFFKQHVPLNLKFIMQLSHTIILLIRLSN